MKRQFCRSRRQFLSVIFLTNLVLHLWLGSLLAGESGLVVAVNASQLEATAALVQQGVDRYKTGQYREAIEVWQNALKEYKSSQNQVNVAIVLENLARAHQQLGETGAAMAYWEQTATAHRQLGNRQQVGRILTEQAQAYSDLGQPRQAISLLCNVANTTQTCSSESALQIARTYQDLPTEAAALGSLGEAYRLMGDYNLAISVLQNGLKIADKTKDSTYRAAVLNSLGNAYANRAQVQYRRANSAVQRGDRREAEKLRQIASQDNSQALTAYQQSLSLTQSQNNLVGQTKALINAIPAYYRAESLEAAAQARQQAEALLANLPASRLKVYAAIDLSHLLEPIPSQDEGLSRIRCLQANLQPRAEQLLNQAIATARQIDDRRAESFALGELGHLYECRQDETQAMELSRQAQLAAEQDQQSKDSLYLWQWQVGRILQKQGKVDQAITAYEQAIATLETIRTDILTANRDIQFDFRDTVEPVYRELIALKLSQEQPIQANAKSLESDRQNLNTVLNTADSLKLAELQNYFGNDCVITAVNTPDNATSNTQATAIFNTIILEDKTAVIVSLPNGEKKFTWIEIDRQSLTEQINEFRRGLERFRVTFDPTSAQKIYDWLIRPFAEDLQQAQVKTLVFVQDGILRTIPMAALYDGKQFLIQQYAIAATPSLSLTEPGAVDRDAFRVLAMGLTEATVIDGQAYQALDNVSKEITEVRQQIPGSKQLLNEEFTRDRLQTEISQTIYSIIHIATHGQFGTDPEETFIVTGNSQKLTLNELDQVIRRFARNNDPLELLTLTACETAAGDDRAALGLAGVAVQAGAKSALASLWRIDDAATAQIAIDFYTNLRQPNMSKAEALRAAQISLIEGATVDDRQYTHPAYWSPFILVGNWL
jgi:CHAT domain-containing protein